MLLACLLWSHGHSPWGALLLCLLNFYSSLSHIFAVIPSDTSLTPCLSSMSLSTWHVIKYLSSCSPSQRGCQ